MAEPVFRPLEWGPELSDDEMRERVDAFCALMQQRRTVRDFSPAPVPREVIEAAVRCAGSAPSGANRQPWHFAIVSDPILKHRIREAAEAEERAFYEGRASDEWLEALAPLGTDANKPFLETAPYLIVCFQQSSGLNPATGQRWKNYYVQESSGIACGFLLTALHYAGLVTLTHTPSPMGFLRNLLGRPKNERAIMIVGVGRPAKNAQVPDISRKTFDEIASWK